MFYDLVVLGISNQYIWNCPSKIILEHYHRHVSATHLDVGVGTGYFLDHCRFPHPNPNITLLDLNPSSLRVTSERLKRYRPQSVLADVFDSLSMLQRYNSVAMTYLLHCLPGSMLEKRVVFEQLSRLLNPGGILFGVTILGSGVGHNQAGRSLLKFYNNRGIFSNQQDSLFALEENLNSLSSEYQITLEGCVALFAVRI